ncbi:MAG: tetratricopeptide repeat protein [Flavobacteriales bacterium]|nr:tetratricopeptide repeat protein [Flavobacteriales bacterium]
MNTNYTTLIERYFDQLLSSEEMIEFEQLKKTDLDFLQEFELFEKSHQVIKLSTIIELKAEIRDIHQKMDTSAKTSRLIKFRRMGIAASVLFIVGLGLYAQQFSNQKLYDDAYTPVGDYITNMDKDISEMEEAMKFFDQQQFDRASELFNGIYATTGDQVALFYAGHSHYQAGRLDQAIESLNEVSNNYQAEAQWYVALAYLKLENVDNAISTLSSLIKNNKDEAFVLKAKKLKGELISPLRKLLF